MSNILVVGGGAAGMMAAGIAAKNGHRVVLLERNDRLGRKLMITGKGRCNVTNNCNLINELIENVPVNGRFLFGAFSRFMPSDTIDFFEDAGVPLKIERGERVFPCSDKAVDIVDALVAFLKKEKVRIKKGRAVSLRCENGRVASLLCEDGEQLIFDDYILATGGKSYPATGSTGDGFVLAAQAGHTIVPPRPSLIPLTLAGDRYRQLQGLSLRNVAIQILDRQTGSCKYEDFGEMLFTHFGVSGPIILSASAHLRDIADGKYQLLIDLKPALSEEKLDARLIRETTEQHNKSMSNVMASLVPKALIPVILENASVNGEIKANQLTRQMRAEIGFALKHLTFTITGTRTIEEAIVTSGGVSVREIDPKTMRSKLCSNLYFAGELIDVDAYTGGFNLQIAFSTGYCAGSNVQ